MFQLDLEKAEEPKIKLPTSVGSFKKQESSKKHLLLLYWLCQSLWLCRSQQTGKFLEMEIPDHLTCLLRNLYASQEATVRTGHGTMDWFKIGKSISRLCTVSLPLHAAFWSQIPVTVASPILSGFGEITFPPPQAVSSLGHYIILCGVSTHICVCNLFVLSSWLKPKGLFPVSTLSDTLRCQVIIHLPYSGTGMSQVEENEGEWKYKMKRESPDATKIWISVPGTLVSTALPSISSVTLVDSMANRQVTRSQCVSMPIWVEFSITCHEVYQDSSWLMKLQSPEIYWASKIVDLVV